VRIDSLSIGSILSNTILYQWRIDWLVIVAKPDSYYLIEHKHALV